MEPLLNKDFFGQFKLLLAEHGSGNYEDRIIDSFPAVVFILNAQRKKVTYINKQVTNQLGYTEDDLTGWDYDINRFFFKDDLETVQQEMEKLFGLPGDEVHTYKSRYNLKSGENKYFKTNASILKRGEGGKPDSILFVAQDITESIRSEEEIKTLRELMDDAEGLLGYGLYQWDFEKDEINYSNYLYKLYGIAKSEVVSANHLNIHRNKHDNELTEKKLQYAIKNHTDFEFEYDYDKDGTTLHLLNKGKFIVPENKDEAPKHIVGIIIDKTFQKQEETNLQKVLEELKRSNKDLEEFAYIASHDLQEPLRKLRTFSERLESRHGETLNEDGKGILKRMGFVTQNMSFLIDSLLDFSKASFSNQPFELTDLNALVNEAIDELDVDAEEIGGKIVVEQLPTIECMPSKFKQVVMNILSNAIKFRHVDRPLEIKISSSEIMGKDATLMGLSEEQTFFTILIKDNGIGFEQEYADKIFQAFQRLNGKAEYAGAGMGLSICKKIIERHAGLIYARSKNDEGATFCIIIPEKQ